MKHDSFFSRTAKALSYGVLFAMLVGLIIPLSSVIVSSEESSFVQSQSMVLLAVSETKEGFSGSTASLSLEVEKGRGRVFLDTSPASKLDTQLSTRFAKEISCSFVEADCSEYDFFYTIQADSSIIGGPSAGAAMAVLTAASLNELNLDDKVAITGTINSGGLIGPVGGLKEKIEAAAQKKLKKVLIPVGSSNIKLSNTSNISLNLVQYGKELGLEVKEVEDLNDAIFEFTGVRLKEEVSEIRLDSAYQDTMRDLASLLCNRSYELEREAALINKWTNDMRSEKQVADNLSRRALISFNASDFYSSASFCFGANVVYKTIVLEMLNLSSKEAAARMDKVDDELSSLNNELEKKEIKTTTDFQTFLVVSERLEEAKEQIDDAKFNLENNSVVRESSIALAEERILSAKSWSFFFGKGSSSLEIDEGNLKSSCNTKISEAEQRIDYARLFVPDTLSETQKTLEDAKKKRSDKKYALCLYKASLAKAESNIFLSVFGFEDSEVVGVTERKIAAAKKIIANQAAEGAFPIVGYSYYEYSKTLLDESRKYSALLYAEYALELSDLDVYFEKQETVTAKRSTPMFSEFFSGFISGLAVGIVIFLVVGFFRNRKVKKRKK